MESHVSQNYSVECGIAVNTVANLEMHASLVYLSMAYYFDRDDVALSQFAKLFKARSEKMWEAAENFLRYQNKRGGRIVLQDIKLCDFLEWEYLDQQVKVIKCLGDHITNLMRLGAPLGQYLFDRLTLEDSS
ncbi:ferritin heavy chain B-like isoform X2 [Tachyglossus aculeatus]|uniref:ferritin heavy chain B-like isoform X2 n=1 Tax=Tachyglossus aculeatus TaxID=9261 RepID=UPI0018F7095A|nr:ferritin heavy chain B-like isoform X2 [Tachyglossus aculeatus]